MSLPGLVKQEDMEVVSPAGEIRCRVKGAFTGSMILVSDTSADIRLGDEIRRQLPNGKEEVFTVDDPTFYSSGPFGPHYQVKVSRPKVVEKNTGGHYSVSVSGNNARVNIHSNDHSVNLVTDSDLFQKMRQTIEDKIGNATDRLEILKAIGHMESAKDDKVSFGKNYQAFISSAAAHMSIVAPFLPALGELLAKLHS
ncbi:hypothetical protein GO281_04811 [Ralstonia solanacearum]|uniref:hypothetical protein n=1 Tax=Ralstonia pseudosolanacearum TaxID=1310165 RepID=UPI001113EF40|nr:hypothetical protein [Ralstonia pseudosolanacearum]MCK4165246.1 hypothetical protein [Ralstonia pseudosolanacearum]NKA61024.1 hypothetical protein [Ralstonia solanacearum]